MYELDWASDKLWSAEGAAAAGSAGPFESRLPRDWVARTMLLFWGEHCVECAPPHCYRSCPLFVERADRKCARLVYGIAPNPRFAGLFDYGADLRFRRWGKLETVLFGPSVGVDRHRRLAAVDRAGVRAVRGASELLRVVSPARKLHGAFNAVRHRLLGDVPTEGDVDDYDAFVLECYSPDPEPFRLILEYRPAAQTTFRHAFEIAPGQNFHTLPADAFPPPPRATDEPTFLTLYPENDREARLIFTWLDFVKYAGDRRPAAAKPTPPASPADKVKCVAWDLDNTLWPGTLIESSPSSLTIAPETIELIRRLDERGILQTVVSKNDHDAAWAVIARHGLEDYFLFPAINWGRKSASLRQVAERLNIGLDALALIDDSPFEREEVRAALPMVRTYTERQAATLLALAEFDVPVTQQSRVRRPSYLTEMRRERAKEEHGGDYADFLRSCGMSMRVFVPTTEGDARRCLELVQRSNQLNLSSRRYTGEEFEELRNTPGVLCAAIRCEDRFGDYGIVGFASVDERPGEAAIVSDFVISCRVAQKRVEHAFFGWLAARQRERGRATLRAQLVVTARNGPLVRVFDDLPFRRVAEQGPAVTLEASTDRVPSDQDIIRVIDEVPR
jgi:FkbH-like protein